MNAIERDALIQALRNLRADMESARKADEGPAVDKAKAGHLAALKALLKKAVPSEPELQAVNEEEPIKSIDTAIAYLQHAPVSDAETDFQSLYDGILVSRLQKSWTIRIAFIVIVAIVVGGDLWLGLRLGGALQHIEEIEERAVKDLTSQSERSANALSRQETEVRDDLVRRRDQINEQTAEQLGRITVIADNAEATVKASILRASQEVVDDLGTEAKNAISQAESNVINAIRQTETGATERINQAAATATDRINAKVEQINGHFELEKQKGDQRIQTKLGAVIIELEKDTTALKEDVESGLDAQTTLANQLEKREGDADRISRTLQRIEKPGGVLYSVAAIADVAWAFFGVMLIGVFVAAGAATATLFDWGKKPLVRGGLAVVLVVGIGLAGWTVGTRWSDFRAFWESSASHSSNGMDTGGLLQSPVEAHASVSIRTALNVSNQGTAPQTSGASEAGS